MSETTVSEKPVEKKGGKKKLIIIIVAVLALVGAGGGAFYIKSAGAKPESGGKGKKAARSEKEEETEKAGETEKDSEESAGAHEDEKDAAAEDEGKSQKGGKKAAGSAKFTPPDDENVKQIIELQPFIVNLADTSEARYLRLTVSVGTGEAEGEAKPDPLFTTRIRNAMLAVLTTKSSEEVLTAEGKNALRKELLSAARSAAKEPKVEAVYITDFIVQL